MVNQFLEEMLNDQDATCFYFLKALENKTKNSNFFNIELNFFAEQLVLH